MKPRVPPPLIALACLALMLALPRMLAAIGAPSPKISFPGQTTLAASLAVAGAAMDIWAVGQFLRAKTTINPLDPDATRTLVTDGLFRITRNPMYLGMALILLGAVVWSGAPINLLALALFVGLINAWQIKPEEAAMRAKFGEAYEAWTRRVRRWI